MNQKCLTSPQRESKHTVLPTRWSSSWLRVVLVLQVLSRQIAELGIYPAVDPLDSTSRMLDPRVIGDVHYETARATQKLLQDYKGLQVGRRFENFSYVIPAVSSFYVVRALIMVCSHTWYLLQAFAMKVCARLAPRSSCRATRAVSPVLQRVEQAERTSIIFTASAVYFFSRQLSWRSWFDFVYSGREGCVRCQACLASLDRNLSSPVED